MKATLKIEDGEVTIKGKGISLEIDSDSTTRLTEAKAKLNFSQAANTAARTAADPNHPVTKLITSIGEDMLKSKKAKDEKPAGGSPAAEATTTSTSARKPYTGARRGRKFAKKAVAKKATKKK